MPYFLSCLLLYTIVYCQLAPYYKWLNCCNYSNLYETYFTSMPKVVIMTVEKTKFIFLNQRNYFLTNFTFIIKYKTCLRALIISISSNIMYMVHVNSMFDVLLC